MRVQTLLNKLESTAERLSFNNQKRYAYLQVEKFNNSNENNHATIDHFDGQGFSITIDLSNNAQKRKSFRI